MSCTTKRDLYRAINQFRVENWIDHTDDVAKECERRKWAKVLSAPFQTEGLKGMSYLASSNAENSLILLSESLSHSEKNFTCAHELIHLKFHNHLKIVAFSCFDKIRPNQNAILEWQANEGAAELIVPMYDLLPIIKEFFPHLKKWEDYNNFKFDLARRFSVTEGVISVRFESLKYEISQYLNGTRIDRIEILSRGGQQAKRIYIKSLNNIEDELWQKEFGNHDINIFA